VNLKFVYIPVQLFLVGYLCSGILNIQYCLISENSAIYGIFKEKILKADYSNFSIAKTKNCFA